MADDKFTARKESLGSAPELTTFNVAAVAEAMDSVWSLKGTEAGLQTIQTREGDWKSWDPDVYGVDEATEGGYIKRLNELGKPIVMLSEESERVEINLDTGGEPLYCVSDPFDGSWLFKRQLPLWWYSSLAFFKQDFTPVSTATGDVNQNLIAFSDETGAYLVTVKNDQLVDKQQLNEEYRQKIAGDAPDVSGDVDVFSGLDIARKSGAVISDFDGKPFQLETDDCQTTYDVIASRNQKIHDEVLEKLASCK